MEHRRSASLFWPLCLVMIDSDTKQSDNTVSYCISHRQVGLFLIKQIKNMRTCFLFQTWLIQISSGTSGTVKHEHKQYSGNSQLLGKCFPGIFWQIIRQISYGNLNTFNFIRVWTCKCPSAKHTYGLFDGYCQSKVTKTLKNTVRPQCPADTT